MTLLKDKKYKFISSLKIDNEIWIRQIEESDFEEFYNLLSKNREYLTPSFQWAKYTTKEISFKIWRGSIFNNQQGIRNLKGEAVLCSCLIFYKNKIVGNVELTSNSETVVEVCYWIDNDYQGKGIMIRTVKSVMDYCLNNLKFEKVFIAIRVENKKSQNLIEKIGRKFKKEFRKSADAYGTGDYYFYYFAK